MQLPQPDPFPQKQPEPPMQPSNRAKARKAAALSSFFIVLTYAGILRWAFAESWLDDSGGVVSMSFIFSVPFACGALSVAIGRMCGSDAWAMQSIIAPVFTMAIGLGICILTQIEAAICVIMAAPILFLGTMFGGLIAHFLLPRNRPVPRLYLTFAVFLPFISAYVEGSLHWPSEMKSITNTITINASASEVWPLIASVDAIDPEQIPDKWIYGIGFPKPIAATLDRHEVGGIRTATFERGVSFFEQVTEWKEPERLSFTIHADPDFIPRTAFDQHIIVGGRFYDVLDGTYEIEPTGPDSCRLHLTSNHRLSTRFNSYAGWWSVKIMDQIQGSILEVIRERAESGS
jgi:hypothetical protein